MSFFGDVGRVTRNGFRRMIDARQQQANRYVASALLNFDDETLARVGYSRKELQKQGRAVSFF